MKEFFFSIAPVGLLSTCRETPQLIQQQVISQGVNNVHALQRFNESNGSFLRFTE